MDYLWIYGLFTWNLGFMNTLVKSKYD
jgi:hypothetical protein